jgi:hypothetical protein
MDRRPDRVANERGQDMARDERHDRTSIGTGGALIREAELAARWRISPRTLARWRRAGRAPAHLVLGRTAIYPLDAIEAFEIARLRPGGTPA